MLAVNITLSTKRHWEKKLPKLLENATMEPPKWVEFRKGLSSAGDIHSRNDISVLLCFYSTQLVYPRR